MANKYVKSIGTAVAVVGVILLGIGISLGAYQEVNRTMSGYTVDQPYEMIGSGLYALGIIGTILGCVIFVIGFFVDPSISELVAAERLVKRNKERLRDYYEDNSDEPRKRP
jgi:hypothetical protein